MAEESATDPQLERLVRCKRPGGRRQAALDLRLEHRQSHALADGIVKQIRDVKVALAINRDAVRRVKPCVAVGAVAVTRSRTADGRDDPVGSLLGDLADLDPYIRDIEIASAVQREPCRRVKARVAVGAIGLAIATSDPAIVVTTQFVPIGVSLRIVQFHWSDT